MADAPNLEDEAGGIGLARLQQILNVTGAAVSVMLVVGLALWGYRLAVRDVTGIPVVRALDGPMRIAPVDPGGTIAGNIGLSVNAIAAEGTAAPPPDQIVLAPRPVDLAPEDQPFAAGSDAPVELSGLEAGDGPINPVAPPEVPTETDLAAPADLLEDSAIGFSDAAIILAEPVAEMTEEADPGDSAAASDPVDEDTVARSVRPMPRPAEMVALAAVTPAAAQPADAAPREPAAIVAGTRLVQLGAFDNEADAVAEWNRLVVQFGELVAARSRVLQDAQSGGRSFVRLRAMGFSDDGDARRFCSALLSENAVCVPVAQR